MARILVTEEIAEGGLDRLRAAGHTVDVQLDLNALHANIRGAQGLIIRSATQVTAEVLEAVTDALAVRPLPRRLRARSTDPVLVIKGTAMIPEAEARLPSSDVTHGRDRAIWRDRRTTTCGR